MRKIVVGLLALLLSCVTWAANDYNQVRFTPQEALEVAGTEGLSGAFAGRIGGDVYVAGGCNFPGVPAAEGGQKVFYSTVFRYNPASHDVLWEKVGNLPQTMAYGASVTVPEGILCLGGTHDGKVSSTEVLLLRHHADSIVFEKKTALPVGLDNFGAALCDGYIYVAGGQNDGTVNHQAWRLAWPHGTTWEQLPDMIGPARIQPAAVCQRGTLGANFYVLGGYDTRYSRCVTNGAYYDPRKNEWFPTSLMLPTADSTQAAALVGATAMASGCSHILCFGGADRTVFNSALERGAALADTTLTASERDSLRALHYEYMTQDVAWYHFREKVLIYCTITDTWTEDFASPRIARCGANIVPLAQSAEHFSWLVVDGEEKPGVRSGEVTKVDVKYTASFGWLNWTVLIVYLLGMVYLGYYFMRRANSSTEDFFKGGGRIPWWAAGISIFATMLSAITYMSIPAKAYATDWTYYPMQILILVVAFPVIRYYLPFFRKLNVTTAYEYLEQRFNYTTRFMASFLFIVFMVARSALVLFLPSLALTAVTGINIFICIALMALITILYCTMGGVEAVVWGDVIQGIILVGGAILAAVYLVVNTGDNGASDFWQIATDNDKFRLFLFDPDNPFDWKNATWWVCILGGLGNNWISYTSDQTVIQRYMTTKDEKSASRGIITNGILSIVVSIAFYTIGTGLYTFFKTHPAAMDVTMSKTDAIFPFFMMSQLPAGIAGLLIAAIFAATMSTIASNINSISTAFTVDFWKHFRRNTSDHQQLRIARRTGVVTGLIAMLIAFLMAVVNIQSLLDYFNTILGLLSGSVGALFFIGIFLKRVGPTAALVGFVCGTATVFYMNFFTPVNFLLFGFISMVVSVVVAWVLSFIFKETKLQTI